MKITLQNVLVLTLTKTRIIYIHGLLLQYYINIIITTQLLIFLKNF